MFRYYFNLIKLHVWARLSLTPFKLPIKTSIMAQTSRDLQRPNAQMKFFESCSFHPRCSTSCSSTPSEFIFIPLLWLFVKCTMLHTKCTCFCISTLTIKKYQRTVLPFQAANRKCPLGSPNWERFTWDLTKLAEQFVTAAAEFQTHFLICSAAW
jgi:hypothetical protein